MTGRVDVHQHMVPEVYGRWLRSQGVEDPGGRQLPEWSPDGALDLMDRQGIGTAILSVSTPGGYLGDGADASRMARQVNERAAEVITARPERFGFFATLTLPDVSAAVAEAAYAFDDSAADGVVLLANSSGVYLGDPAFDPLLAALDERAAVGFAHPDELPGHGAVGGGTARCSGRWAGRDVSWPRQAEHQRYDPRGKMPLAHHTAGSARTVS